MPTQGQARVQRSTIPYIMLSLRGPEFFTVLLVFRGIVISIPQNSGGFRNGHRNHQNGIASGIDQNRICGIFFNSNYY